MNLLRAQQLMQTPATSCLTNCLGVLMAAANGGVDIIAATNVADARSQPFGLSEGLAGPLPRSSSRLLELCFLQKTVRIQAVKLVAVITS